MGRMMLRWERYLILIPKFSFLSNHRQVKLVLTFDGQEARHYERITFVELHLREDQWGVGPSRGRQVGGQVNQGAAFVRQRACAISDDVDLTVNRGIGCYRPLGAQRSVLGNACDVYHVGVIRQRELV